MINPHPNRRAVAIAAVKSAGNASTSVTSPLRTTATSRHHRAATYAVPVAFAASASTASTNASTVSTTRAGGSTPSRVTTNTGTSSAVTRRR